MKLKNLITNKHANEIMSLNAKVKMQQDQLNKKNLENQQLIAKLNSKENEINDLKSLY